MEIKLKPLEEDEIDVAYDIHRQAFADECMSRNAFYDEVCNKSRKYYIALCDNNCVGYIGAWDTGTDYSIISIAVDEDYRRQGVAGALIDRVKRQAEMDHISALSLEVCEDNTPAIELYKKHGFIVTNIRKNYYKNNKSAYIMWLYL